MDPRTAQADRVKPRAKGSSARRGGARAPVARRHGPDLAPDNLLVHGDNLVALTKLAGRFAGRSAASTSIRRSTRGVRLQNTTTRSAPREWAAMMRPRLEALLPLLAEDGAVFAEIDDTQLGHLMLLMDEVFGAKNRISTITVVRSAADRAQGHQRRAGARLRLRPRLREGQEEVALSPAGPRARRPRPRVRDLARRPRRRAGALDVPPAPQRHRRAARLRHPARGRRGRSGARPSIGALVDLALASARHVVRFAQPRYEAIGRAAQVVVDRSRAAPERVFVLDREGRSAFIVRGGNRILFLGDKVRVVDGRPAIVEPLTNVWTDVPFQGIAREGGVVFTRNKKPERLVARILAMATRPRRLGARSVPRQRHDRRRRAQDEPPLDRDRVRRSSHHARRASPRARRRRRGRDGHHPRDGLRRRRLVRGGGGLTT